MRRFNALCSRNAAPLAGSLCVRWVRLPRPAVLGGTHGGPKGKVLQFDEWMRRTITVLYTTQLLISVVKGIAVIGTSLAALYGLYRMQCRADRSREALSDAMASANAARLATAEGAKRKASEVRDRLNERKEQLAASVPEHIVRAREAAQDSPRLQSAMEALSPAMSALAAARSKVTASVSGDGLQK